MNHGLPYIPYESDEAMTDYQSISTQLEFCWICPRCNHIGHMSYDNFTVYKGIVECPDCDTPWRLKEPWK